MITIILINHYSGESLAGAIEIDNSNTDKMLGVNLDDRWQKPQGFLWYSKQLEPKIKRQSTRPNLSLLQKIEPHDQRIESLKQQFNKAQRIALDNPILENVIVAQKLQQQIMEKAQKFATMWQLATLLDHQLTNINEPVNSLHKKLYEEKLAQNNSAKLKNLAKDWGLILQIDNNCSYSKAFIPIVQQFAAKHKFQLLFVSNSPQFEDRQDIETVKDTGLLNKLNPENIVPVLYLIESSGRKIYPIARGLISEDKIIDNIMTIDLHYQKLLGLKVNHE